ncbi:MAG: hypothetical protein Ct9H300mP14_12830 [Gammaproteobacteria bacterium]|nr:MAG: hypothetical protein Ct9H300mP14_12830 [Gammaproteobacteria bacterium]
MEKGNSLLASLGDKAGRTLVNCLNLMRDEEVFCPPASNTLLGQIQPIFSSSGGQGEGVQREVDPSDSSIQIHVCHSRCGKWRCYRSPVGSV